MLAESVSKLPLKEFFSQWLDGTGAPEYTNNYSIFRLGGDKGFRTVGSVTQDLDLFSMPGEMRIETGGKDGESAGEISGNEAPYSVDTSGEPTKILLDPDNWLLKSTPDLTVPRTFCWGMSLWLREI